VAPDCPVPQEDKAPTINFALNPNGWVTRRRTGQSGAPIACSFPNHHNLKHPRFLNITFNTRALAFTPRHNSKDQSLSKSQIHLKHLVTCKREISCSFELLLLGLPLFFSHSYSQVLCKRGKRHQVCGGPCGVSDL
jgi:hypothetical protein